MFVKRRRLRKELLLPLLSELKAGEMFGAMAAMEQ